MQNNINNKNQNYIRIFFVYLAASLFIGVPFALLSGVWPKSAKGWVIVFILGLPSLILCEFIGEKLFSNKISQTIDKDKKEKILSIRRMGYALIIGIIITVLVTLLGFFLRKNVGAHFNIY